MSNYTGFDVKLPREVAETITILTLQDCMEYLTEELRLHKEEGEYLHPDDAIATEYTLLPALRALIAFFGGPR
jgi:hypothetical protein